jgi:hypothetical protein
MEKYFYAILFFVSFSASTTQMDALLANGFNKSEICSQVNMSDPAIFLNRLTTESVRISKAQQIWQGKAAQSTGQAQQYVQQQVTEVSKSLSYIDNLKVFFNSNSLRKR